MMANTNCGVEYARGEGDKDQNSDVNEISGQSANHAHQNTHRCIQIRIVAVERQHYRESEEPKRVAREQRAHMVNLDEVKQQHVETAVTKTDRH